MTVSIIVPVYNVAPFIEVCLKSVMAQTFMGSIECLLIDDCGTDNSIAIAESIIASYTGPIHFEILHHEGNLGLSAARNTGMKHAIGEYLYFLDSDDWIAENCIALLMERAMANPAVEMVQGNVITLPIKNTERLTVKVRFAEATSNSMVRKCFYKTGQLNVAAWNKLIKRSFIQDHALFFWEGVIYEDTPWLFHMLKYLNHVSFVSDYTYYYQRRKNSILTGSSKAQKAENLRKVYRHVLDNLSCGYEHEEIDYFAKKFAYLFARYSRETTAYKEDLPCWLEKTKAHGSNCVRRRLDVGCYLAKWKYGWLLLSLINRIDYPSVILYDFQRVWNKIIN